jgi:hypothetical protein
MCIYILIWCCSFYVASMLRIHAGHFNFKPDSESNYYRTLGIVLTLYIIRLKTVLFLREYVTPVSDRKWLLQSIVSTRFKLLPPSELIVYYYASVHWICVFGNAIVLQLAKKRPYGTSEERNVLYHVGTLRKAFTVDHRQHVVRTYVLTYSENSHLLNYANTNYGQCKYFFLAFL